MDKKCLFRSEALDARADSRRLHSDVLLFLPSSHRKILAFIIVAVLLMLALLIFGSYTRRVNVKGELFSTLGAIPVYLPRSGVISEYFVSEDQPVRKGDPLFAVATEVFGLANRGTSSETIHLLVERKYLLEHQLESETATHVQNLRNIDDQVRSKQKERRLIMTQIQAIRKKNELLSASLERYQEARVQEAISDDAMADKTITTLNSRIDYNERERQLEALGRDVSNLSFEREKADSEHGRRVLQLKADLLALEEQIIAAEYQKGAIIKAPASGNVTAIQGVSGSYYDNTKPVSFIVPADSEIEARLMVPATAIGFIKKGDTVYLRYSAYSYQRFGQGKGTVYSISGAALLPNDIALGSKLSITEPMFLVKARIRDKTVIADGIRYALKPGIAVDADIMLEQDRIYRWILRPLFSVSEKLKH
ncbi:HlyD family secretion protein [Burkholderia multivorans]|uniref:HlyD family secretion protein n=1 Tax=Burkholderia multivorans TaxID=87883 RepID=UPI00027820A3|nr:HlyD family efflux transporter periplasmic adaptor subunit [Burkholderia multivorans]EJO53962.1 hypothetical protein BURMUCF2_A1990 [Burkholderia multivorans CF2]MBU9474633.1 HlyD family efflux transporter periplasmic adaptor subunit [Burkholderia multivorans]